MRISDWSSDVCSSDLPHRNSGGRHSRSGNSLGSKATGGRYDSQLERTFHDTGPVSADHRDRRRRSRRQCRQQQIGRASCRERVCPYVYISVVAVSLTTTNDQSKLSPEYHTSSI